MEKPSKWLEERGGGGGTEARDGVCGEKEREDFTVLPVSRDAVYFRSIKHLSYFVRNMKTRCLIKES